MKRYRFRRAYATNKIETNCPAWATILFPPKRCENSAVACAGFSFAELFPVKRANSKKIRQCPTMTTWTLDTRIDGKGAEVIIPCRDGDCFQRNGRLTIKYPKAFITSTDKQSKGKLGEVRPD